MYRKNKRKVRKYRKWVYGFLAVFLLLTMIPIFPERVSAATQEIMGGPFCQNNLPGGGDSWGSWSGSGIGATEVYTGMGSARYKCDGTTQPTNRFIDIGRSIKTSDYRIFVYIEGSYHTDIHASNNAAGDSWRPNGTNLYTWTNVTKFYADRYYQGKWLDITDSITLRDVRYFRAVGDSQQTSAEISKFGIRVIPKSDLMPKPPQIHAGTEGQAITGWTKEPVTVWINGDVAPEGLKYYEYSLNGGAFQQYTGPFTVYEHGVNTIYARTVDVNNQYSGLSSGNVRIDKMPPTPPTLSATGNSNDYTISLQPGTDDYSGLAHTQFRLTGVVNQDWQGYVGVFHVNKDGKSTVYARSIDSVGNVSQEVSKEITIDKKGPTAPVIRASETGPTNRDVNVTIDSGSDSTNGIKMTQYRLGPLGEWRTYNGTFTLNAEGTYELAARTINNLDVYSPIVTQSVMIDRTQPTPPKVTFSEVTTPTRYTNKPVEFALSGATDTTAVHYEYQLGSGTYVPGSLGILKDSGIIKVTAQAVDAAGNRSDPVSVMSYIDLEPPTIQLTPDSREWKDTPIHVRIRYADQHSGIESSTMQYKITNSPDSPENWDTAADTTIQKDLSDEGEWYVHAKVKDRVGNIYETVSSALRIQKQPQSVVLSATSVRNTEADLQWTLPSGLDDGYVYTVRNLTTNEVWDVTHPTNSFTVRGLQEGRQYEYEVRSSNHVGGNAYSNRVHVLTLPDAPDHIQLRPVPRHSTEILADFTPVSSANKYNITVADVSTGETIFKDTVTQDVYNPITGMKPGQYYDVSVSAINDTGEGTAKHVSFLSLPDSPNGFRNVTVREDGIDLKWNSVITATYYALERDKVSVYNDVYTEFTDSDLQAGTEYGYNVSAANATGFGDYAHLGVITLPDRVTTISSVTKDVYAIGVAWQDVQGAEGYILNVNDEPKVRVARGIHSYTFEGLPAGRSANIKIRAYNRSGTGKDTSINALTLPDSVVQLAAEDVREHDATLIWAPVDGATQYKVTINSQNFYSTEPRVVVSGLTGGRNYDFQVSSGNSSGFSQPALGELLTLPPEVQNVNVTELEGGQISLSWDEIKSSSQYTVTRKDTGEVFNTRDAHIKLSDIQPGMIYSFAIQAVNTTGVGNLAPFTYRALPGQISDNRLTVKEVTDTDLVVTWKEASGADTYNVYQNGVLIGHTTSHEFKVDGLDSSTLYRITVKPLNTSGEGKQTEDQVETLPSPAFAFLKTETTNSEFIIHWESDHENDIFVLASEGGTELYRGKDRSYIWRQLKEKQLYTVQLWAENSQGKRTEAKQAHGKTTGNTVDVGGGAGGAESVKPIQPVIKEPIETEHIQDSTVEKKPNHFSDIDRIFNKEKINVLADLGIVKGTTHTLFEPNRPVTRMEFTSMLVRSLKLPLETDVTLGFEDINPSAWYVDLLKTAIKDQVARGFSSREFGPDRVINREQAAKMVNNIIKATPQQESSAYSDSSQIVEWARKDVLGLTEINLVQGYPDGSFRAKQEVTRAEAAEMIYNMLQMK
ncbi:fibronectin type III domain-containing protein [Paenibacillus sp. EKM212P]|uniref:fibronectin type III domain-containing protein n=1 Tax=Paenibacillus sp. EKM212P TaxID=1683680 RepID=UPI0013EBE8FF|nr:fibronectin type III domain-containing protein [Paenibacillus sp. EKM212P]KAF6578339.1 fibronectin type III domain-containing protein [Paenibacillus sp. EKM212P]